jgi:Protein of unknown function (DUF3108)
MKTLLLKCAAIAALAVASGATAAPLTAKTTLYYDISMAGVVLAEGTETLEQDGKTYRISSEARGKGIVASLYRGAIKRSVSGTVHPQGLRPTEFQDQRADHDPAIAHFDWNKKTITFNHDGKTETVAMPANAIDRLSFFYQFAFMPLPAGELHVIAVDGKGTTQFDFLAPVREKLATPLGELDTVKLTKRPDGPGDKQTEVWLAPALHNLPVRVLVTDNNGNKADQVISRIEPHP